MRGILSEWARVAFRGLGSKNPRFWLRLGLVGGLSLSVVLAIYAATTTLYPSTNAIAGIVANPTNVYADDSASADVSTSNLTNSLSAASFANTNLGTVTNVTVWVKYKTSAAPGNDTYQFDAATDGSTFNQSIVAANSTNRTAYVTASLSLGALTWAQVGTLAVRCQTNRSGGSDGYSVNWDVAYIVITYTPTNNTAAGAVTATANGCGAINVSAPYTGDANGNNSLSYRYRTPATTGTWSSATPVSHSASPYSFNISSLSQGTYDAEVTYVDGDGVTGTNPQTVSGLSVGVNCTAAGVVTAAQTAGSTPSIAVSAPYTYDNNGNNTLSYRYRTPSGTGAWSSSTPVSHGASPYSFSIAGLTCGSTYDVEVTYADSDGIASGTQVQTISGIPLNNCTSAGTPTAAVDACNQITVSAPFTNDANVNGTTNFERGASGTGPWTSVCTGKTGASPRTCVDTGVSASSTYYYRVTYSDADGISGTAQQVIGPYSTPSCATLPVTPGTPTATVDSCTQITASAPFTGDTNGNSTTTFSVGTSPTGPWTAKCTAVTGASPRSCALAGLTQNTAYYVQVDFADTDGVGGTDPQVIGPFTTQDCRVAPQAASATVNTCNRVTVSAPFNGDSNANSTTTVRRGTALAGPFNDTICTGLTGASPRTCVDSTALSGTTYYYQVAFADADGVNGSATQVLGPMLTPACSDPKTTPGALTLTPATCDSIIASAAFTGDGDGDGTTRFEYNTSNSWPGTVACAAVGGSSPRQCTLTGLTPGTTYWVRAVFTDPDGLSGADPSPGSTATPSPCGADKVAPTVLFQSPTRAAVIGGVERVKVQVYDAGGLGGLSVQWKVDGGSFAAAAANANYACGANCAVYEFDVNTTGGVLGGVAPLSLFNMAHTLWVQAQDIAGNKTLLGLPVTVNNVGGSPTTAGTAAAGNGLLLRRTHGSETCLDCHNLKTHSSQETSTKYGSWAVDCLSCHTPHRTTNIHLVSNQIQTPNSGLKNPVFQADDKAGGTNPAGSYLGPSFAIYDDGVCEVCHTKTTHYRNDTSGGDHTHNQSQRCIGCHKHTEGFRGAGCDGCHGNPPVLATLGGPSGLADSEGGTGATTPGMHSAHAAGGTGYSFPCATCHTGGMPASTVYDKKLQVGFDLFSGAYVGGGYDGRASLANGYSYEAGNPSTTLTQGGNLRCTNLYCHGSTMNSGGDMNGGTNITPTWSDASTGACGTCHGATAAMPPQRGMHFRHAGPVTDVGHQYACALCHTDPSVDKSNHVNNLSEVVFSSDPKVSGGSYTGTPAMMDAYGNCSNIYCHSNVQTSPPGGPLTYSPPASANWGNDATYTCDPCHSGPADHFSNPQGGQTSGSHPKHDGMYCSDCHALNRTVARADCGACHTATGPNEFHGDHAVDVNILTAFGATASYSGTPAPGDAYGSCSSVYCHGTGTPQWGSTLNCSGCHKANNTLANSHSKHYESATLATATTATFGSTEAGYLYGCGYCHPSGTANHAQGAVSSVQAAQVAFSGTLPGGQTVSGTYVAAGTAAGTDSGFSYTAGTCSNLYCHSNAAPLSGTDSKKSVTWTSTITCSSCHNTQAKGDTAVATDLSAAHGKHIQSTAGETGSYAYTCNACHAGVIKDGAANPWSLTGADFNTAAGKGKALHVQGQHSVSFSGTLLGVNQAAGTYNGGAYTCGSTYCHSDGTTATAPFGSTTSIAWSATADAECDSCHGGNSTSTTTTGKGPLATASHSKHISGPWTLSCTTCHNTVVSADRTVSSKTLHVNGAKNVSMGTGSWTSPTCSATGTGCHGAGTPTWGGTVYCINCHGAAADSANWSATDGVMSQINTTEWAYSGHGKASGTYDVTGNTAANLGAGGANPCLYCHDDEVNHKVTTNPFRLRSSATTNQVCLNCHATGSAGVQPAGYTLLNGVSKVNAYHYPASGGKHGAGNNGGKFCWDCHDPHGDRISGSGNVAMIGASVAKQSDGTYGIPTTQVTPTFTANATGTDFAWGTSKTPNYGGICNVCHATTGHYTATASDGHNSGQKCDQAGCHVHDQGPDKAFFAGESSGDDDCLTCHSHGMVVSESGRTGTYHHVLETANKLVSSITSYPTAAAPTVSTADLDKTCTQCHADHNVFRPDVNAGNTLGRGANMRTRIASGPPTAAKGSALNAAPGDVAGSYYSNRDADGAFPSGGICLSCHTTAQTKNVADQKTYTGDPGSTTAIVSAAGNFSSSAHGFTVAGAITNGSSAFTVACTKCHGENTTAYQNGTYKFDMHTSANRRLLQTLGITSPADPLEENFCFRCHSRTTDTTPGGGPVKGTANRDYYNQTAMSAQSEKVFNQFSTAASYPWDHPVQGTGGLHDPVEGTAANDGTIGGTQRHIQCEDCHNPHASAPIASGIYTGSVTGYTTAADPTPDTLSDSTKAWTVNALKGLTVKMTTGAQAGKYSVIYANTATALSVNFGTAPVATDKYIIVNWGFTSASGTLAGNLVSPAMKDVWGLSPTWPSQPAPPNWNDSAGTATAAEIAGQYTAISTWNRTASTTTQGQICIKCHSAYAYGSSPPNTPSGAGNSSTTTWSNTAGAATAQSDIANQFNPNNLAHHAVFARGKNQPLVSSDTVTSTYNPNWPKYTTGTVGATNGSTAVTLTGGTWPVTILPGWFIYIGSAAPAQATAGWYEVAAVGSTTTLTLDRTYTGTTGTGKAFMLTAGLGNNFVPPYGPWSTLSCTDCHSSSVQSDPLGPHGSAIKWLLKGGEPQNFLFYNGTNVVTVTYTPDTYNLCMNCHRRDVYGDYTITGPAFANYARQSHPIDAGKDHSIDYRSSWGIVCMNCHGGARIGQIHGSNLGKGLNGTAGSYSGKRLLAGSSWYAVTRGTTTTTGACWTKGATDSVDTCGHTHSGVAFISGNANYNYDTNP